MNKCPQCGQPRQAEEYRCLKCGCFYSQLDEILAAEQAEQEKHSFKGRLKAIRQAENPQQALLAELRSIKQNTPTQTFVVFAVIFMFIFALIVSVL
jgi:uncharacterized membrane protein YvbJ